MRLHDGGGWESMRFDDGPGYGIMATTGLEREVVKLDNGPSWGMKTTGPNWGLNFDGGSGWQLHGPPDGWEKTLQFGPGETSTALLH